MSSITKKPSARKTAHKTAAKKAKARAARQSVAKKPAVKKPAVKKPAVKKPAAKKRAAEITPKPTSVRRSADKRRFRAGTKKASAKNGASAGLYGTERGGQDPERP